MLERENSLWMECLLILSNLSRPGRLSFSLSLSSTISYRETLLCPLIVSDLLGRLSITATTKGMGGETAVPRAVR